MVLFINPAQLNAAVKDSLSPEAMEEPVQLRDYNKIKGNEHHNTKLNSLGKGLEAILAGC